MLSEFQSRTINSVITLKPLKNTYITPVVFNATKKLEELVILLLQTQYLSFNMYKKTLWSDCGSYHVHISTSDQFGADNSPLKVNMWF